MPRIEERKTTKVFVGDLLVFDSHTGGHRERDSLGHQNIILLLALSGGVSTFKLATYIIRKRLTD